MVPCLEARVLGPFGGRHLLLRSLSVASGQIPIQHLIVLAKQAFVFRLCVMSLEKWRSEVGSADF